MITITDEEIENIEWRIKNRHELNYGTTWAFSTLQKLIDHYKAQQREILILRASLQMNRSAIEAPLKGLISAQNDEIAKLKKTVDFAKECLKMEWSK